MYHRTHRSDSRDRDVVKRESAAFHANRNHAQHAALQVIPGAIRRDDVIQGLGERDIDQMRLRRAANIRVDDDGQSVLARDLRHGGRDGRARGDVDLEQATLGRRRQCWSGYVGGKRRQIGGRHRRPRRRSRQRRNSRALRRFDAHAMHFVHLRRRRTTMAIVAAWTPKAWT